MTSGPSRTRGNISALELLPYSFCLYRLATLALRLGVSSWVLAALRGLSVGLIGLLGRRGLFMQYVATDAGLASYRVRLWQGGPASILTSSSGSSCTAEAPLVPSGTEMLSLFFPCTATVNGAAGHNRGEVAETPPLARTQGRTVDCSLNVYMVCVSSHTWT